jgi:hypothetical protein
MRFFVPPGGTCAPGSEVCFWRTWARSSHSVLHACSPRRLCNTPRCRLRQAVDFFGLCAQIAICVQHPLLKSVVSLVTFSLTRSWCLEWRKPVTIRFRTRRSLRTNVENALIGCNGLEFCKQYDALCFLLNRCHRTHRNANYFTATERVECACACTCAAGRQGTKSELLSFSQQIPWLRLKSL